MRRNTLFAVGMHLALLTIVIGCTPVETRHPSASPAPDHDPDQPTAKRAATGLSVPTKAGQDGLTTQSAQPSGQRDGQVTSLEVEKKGKSTCQGGVRCIYKYVDQEGKGRYTDEPLDDSKYTLEWAKPSRVLVESARKRPTLPYKNIPLTENQVAEIKKRVGNLLRDPYSARYHSIQGALVKHGSKRVTVACGLVNAKNGYGGYVGKAPFSGIFVKHGEFSVGNVGWNAIDSRSVIEGCLAFGIKFDL